MRGLVEFFIRRPLLVNLMVVIIFLAGLFTFSTIERQGFPNVDIMEVVISTLYPGASPRDVELNVTIPLEDAMQEISGIKNISSISYEGMSTVLVSLDEDLTEDEAEDAKREIQKAIDQVNDLPAEVSDRPTMTEIKMTLFPVVELALQGEDEEELREFSKKLKSKIERISGISYISQVGFRDKEVKIEVDSNKLIASETAINDVVNAIRARNVRMSGGTIDSYVNERNIVTIEEFQNTDQVREVIVRSNFSGKVLRVKDVAQVREGYEKQNLVVRSNGKTSISLCIHKQDKEDVLRVMDRLVDMLKKEDFPKGISYMLVNDLSYYTRNRLKIVTSNAIIGMLLVFGTLLIFLEFRSAFWTAFGIPFSLMLAIIFLAHNGMSINIISLAGFILVLGMLVDDAIVVAENVKRYHEEGKTGIQGTVDAVMEILMPVATTITTTIVAFAPMLLMTGIMGKFMWAMPMVVIFALAASLLESIFILPCHLSHAGIKKDNHIPKPKKQFIINLENIYQNKLRVVLKYRYLTLGLTVIALIVTIGFAMATLDFQLMPKSGIEAFFIKMYAPRGTSLEKMTALVVPVEDIVKKLPKKELKNFAARIGYDTPYYWTDRGDHENYAIIYVYLTPMNNRDRYADAILEDLKKQMKPFEKHFERVVYELDNSGPPVGKPITIRLLSHNDSQRVAAAQEVQAFLEKLPGATDIDNDNKLGKDEVKINIDYEQLAKLGLTVQDVALTLRTAYDGVEVTSIRQSDEEVQYRVQLQKQFRKDTSYLLDLPVRNRAGNLVRLKRFANLSIQKSAMEIKRYDRVRSITLSGEVNNKITTPFKIMIKAKKFFETIQEKYPEVILEVSGEGQETQDSMIALFKTFLLALLGIYFLLVLLFNSFLQPIFVMSSIPLSIIGVLWAFILHNATITFQASIGFVGLAGVVVNDSLIMVSYINSIHRQHKNGESDVEFIDSIVRGARTRLRPILLTTITTVIAVVPMIYGWGGTDEFIVPMAMTLGYGLMGASLLTLLIVPCLLYIHHDFEGLLRELHKRAMYMRNRKTE